MPNARHVGFAGRDAAQEGQTEWRQPWYELRRPRRLGHASYERLKRALDLCLTMAAFPFALVVLALCVFAIKLESPGPAWFTQLRTGKHGRRFPMFKLRTMVPNAEELKACYMHLNEHTYPDFKVTNDPRVTRCGRVLRKLSLDELPQIFNVMKGDMSLVGPRPTSFPADAYRLWHTTRLEVAPGLTGLWQIEGRDEPDFDNRIRLDIAYIRNRCLWLDLQILLRTAGAVARTRGAS
jgi:lipopolysaccharide/colanic/teichoic acid biosynthesis glycosyltransferase